jgi:hypothetical protein
MQLGCCFVSVIWVALTVLGLAKGGFGGGDAGVGLAIGVSGGSGGSSRSARWGMVRGEVTKGGEGDGWGGGLQRAFAAWAELWWSPLGSLSPRCGRLLLGILPPDYLGSV